MYIASLYRRKMISDESRLLELWLTIGMVAILLKRWLTIGMVVILLEWWLYYWNGGYTIEKVAHY